MKPRSSLHYPVLPWFCPHMLLGRGAGLRALLGWDALLCTDASSSDLVSSRLLEEPRRRGPVTKKLLRNLKQKRNSLSCTGREGRAGVRGGGCTGGGPTANWEKAQPKPAGGQSRQDGAWPALPAAGAALPSHGPPAPSGGGSLKYVLVAESQSSLRARGRGCKEKPLLPPAR